jgi:hypothetical protein
MRATVTLDPDVAAKLKTVRADLERERRTARAFTQYVQPSDGSARLATS